ncbi:16S rRNA (cytosine1402-N4)-methyltransferase [Stella humosa]|uniref:Ribosomal RNA small subunit methyltransferase H n=1 Tax=Stella humosa TaxID=94 RepID=A0A3N1KY34_9PROT|nr:16S rRNA (cytosine(1402)-N(4))-methyltransferase RsmH [Stella humosa]ROP84107.1 16S rRNA (cytosine1402-N4)-methyltransferase [Stella humosa]BBK33619.1 ribosomal RNA small subunit methyltransferase H [Stella humosa]
MFEEPAGGHVPVLLREVLAALEPRADAIYVDGTFGAGGYSAAILATAGTRVWGIDRDPAAIARGRAMAGRWDGRLNLVEGCFGDMDRLLADHGVDRVDGVALDLGVSSPQIDTPDRGFSFRTDGPLDMRMGDHGPTAADLVATTEERDMADIIFRYGEERHARRVARAIVTARANDPITRTSTLAEIVRRAVPRSNDGIDPATRTFQALRIAVNDEMGELARGLDAAERLLAPGGRLAVVSFHSLEDRAVKAFLRERSGVTDGSRHLPPVSRPPASFRLLGGKAVRPDGDESAGNPRARSARLRAAERTQAPPWSLTSRLATGSITASAALRGGSA